jgi:hypothetical protein
MKNSKWVALALSTLVFPGTGHFLYKRWLRGIMWASVFGLIVLGMMAVLGTTLSQMGDAIMSPTGEVPIDVQKLGLGALLGLGSFGVWGLAALDTWLVSRQVQRVQDAQLGLTPAER